MKASRSSSAISSSATRTTTGKDRRKSFLGLTLFRSTQPLSPNVKQTFVTHHYKTAPRSRSSSAISSSATRVTIGANRTGTLFSFDSVCVFVCVLITYCSPASEYKYKKTKKNDRPLLLPVVQRGLSLVRI